MHQQEKKTVGRPPADEPKTEHIRIRVTKSEKAMLKHSGVNMSNLINTGLKIVMPTLGSKWNGKEWEAYKIKGIDANTVAYRATNVAIEMLMDSWEVAYQSDKPLTEPESSLLKLLRKQKEELQQHCTFHIQKETP